MKVTHFQRIRLVVICIAGLLFAFPSASHGQELAPHFEPADCLIDMPDSPPIECGYLLVTEDYDEPSGEIIRLPIVIIHSHNLNPKPDPILYTEGGPGYSSLTAVWGWAQSDYVNDRDVVIMEQRGNLWAEPNLACDISMWWEEGPGNTPCLDSLTERDIDLSHYTTAAIVKDIDALQQALDYEGWNLIGSSYSTRLMQLAMHRYPDNIRSVILQSTSSITETRYEHDPEHTIRPLNVMFEDCATDPACAAAYPNLEAQLYEVVRELNAKPASFEAVDFETGKTFTETVNGTRFLDWMATDSFYRPARPPHKTAYMPLLIDQVAQGETDLLFPWLNEQVNRHFYDTDFAWGLYFSINCQDDGASISLEVGDRGTAVSPQLDGYIRHKREMEICQTWNLLASPPLITEPLTSDIPTLILAGSYDPITPPSWGQAISENLSHSYYYEFPSSGHNVDRDNPCAQSIKVSFLNDPITEPDTHCLSEAPDPAFVLPDEIAIASGIYHIVYDIDMGNPTRGKPLLEFLAGVSLFLFLVAIVYLLGMGIVGLFRQHQEHEASDLAARILTYVAAATAVTGWVTILVMSRVTNHFTHTNWTILYFGLPLDYVPAVLLAVLALLFIGLTVGLVVLMALAWKRHGGSVPGRIFFTLVSAAAIFFSALLIRWDLHSLLF